MAMRAERLKHGFSRYAKSERLEARNDHVQDGLIISIMIETVWDFLEVKYSLRWRKCET